MLDTHHPRLKQLAFGCTCVTRHREPNEGEEGHDENGHVPPWMHSASSTSSEGEAAGWRYDLGTANNSSHMPVHGLPSPWSALLSRLARSGTISLSPLSQAELVAAAHDSLRHKDALPLRLRTGVLEDHYLLKRELASGAHFEVTEGVQRETQRNYSVKIVSRHVTARLGPAGAGRQLDPMQAFYLICSFVDEVFAQPHSVCLCMKYASRAHPTIVAAATAIAIAFVLNYPLRLAPRAQMGVPRGGRFTPALLPDSRRARPPARAPATRGTA